MTTSTPRSSDDVVAGLIADTSPYLSCDECFERLDEYVETRSRNPEHTDAAMDAHLHGCAACHEEAEGLLELVAQDAGPLSAG
jgi:hypothetical protein